ncbi:MAG: hypothetical protein NTV88_01495 [Candidatus Micrarchaeota archaeon]|nr:hypothetical protein [Candidatus Micrarchaeota archaeon]
MKGLVALFGFILLLATVSHADFMLKPYLYSSDANGTINYTSFSYNNSTAKIVNINGIPALVLLNEQMVTDKGQIGGIIKAYYDANFYLSPEDIATLHDAEDAFNKSRNYMSKYGPVEKTCRSGGTFLDYKPCNDMVSCTQTASLICYVTGSDGCMVDVLATYILDYKKGIDKLEAGNTQFESAYLMLTPDTMGTSFPQMSDALATMKQGADIVAINKLRFPEKTYCADCIGVCPEAHFDYDSLKAAQNSITALQAKTAPYTKLESTIELVSTSTDDRINYKLGEEKAIIFSPKMKSATAKFAGLKAQAIEAKALVSDSNFVAAADSYLNKADALEQDFAMRKFDSFTNEISAYETAGLTLQSMINNSTSAYKIALEAQDSASDKVLEAQWSVNQLSKSSVDSYNSIATRKTQLDSGFKPPATGAQYAALANNYNKVQVDAQTYVAASKSVQQSIFGAGNALGRTSVDGVMSLASSMTPISYKTRKSVATFIPPLVLGIIDISILAIGLLIFVGIFSYFRGGLFRNKLAASGWAMIFLGFVFALIVGSGAFYAIVMSTEQYTSFSDFFGTFKNSASATVIVEETSASQAAVAAMHDCAGQIETQNRLLGKTTNKYYINGNACTSIIPNPAKNNSSEATYTITNSLKASDCLDKMPDVPIFDLYYSTDNKAPVFTTVVTKTATFKYNEAMYGKKPMCPAADILN